MSNKGGPVVLLTGATGFLGSTLLRGLLDNSYKVVILKRSFSNTQRIENLLPKVQHYNLDKTPLRRVFEEQNISIVIHTATNYGRNKESASQIVESNLLFPIELLELSHEFKVGTFFNSDTVLSDRLSFYALSKKHFLDYAHCLSQKCELSFVNVCLEHIYGPNDDRSKFITFLIRSFLEHEASVDLTAGKQLRDFIYVEDIVDAFLILLERRRELDSPFITFDLGSGKTISIEDLAILTHKLCDGNTKIRLGVLAYRDGEIMRSQADNSKLQKMGWSPKTSIHEGLSRTIQAEREVVIK